MRDAPLGEISIPEAAAVAGLSLHHFIRLFHEVYSVSPRAFLSGLQFERAKQLLARSQCSVSEVAIETGFASISAFSRFFRVRAGCTPTQYRARLAASVISRPN